MNDFPRLKPGYIQRIFQLLLFTFFGLIVAGLIMGLITRGGVTTQSLRIATIVQDLLIFIVPAILTSVLVTDRPDRLLATDRGFHPSVLILSVVIMIVSIPAMNALVAWNESISLPQSLNGLENWMRTSENTARDSINILMGGTSIADLIISLLIIAVMAGFSEEIFFRGALQRLIASGRLNHHTAIWLTAFLFSAFHVQFFGFFPRLLLGAFFGYLLYWSGSIWLPVTIHILNNAMVVVSEWYSKVNPGSILAEVDKFGTVSFWPAAISAIATAVLIVIFSGMSGRIVGKTK